MKRLAIGMTGKKGSGKNTAADIISDVLIHWGIAHSGELAKVTQIAFADKLREAMEALDPWLCDRGTPALLSDVLSAYGGWEGVKKTRWANEVRRLLQRGGTEMGRNTINESVWVDSAMNSSAFSPSSSPIGSVGLVGTEHVIFTDVRFTNEVAAIRGLRDRNFEPVIIKVERDAADTSDAHVSENLQVTPDITLYNSSSMEHLRSQIVFSMNEIL